MDIPSWSIYAISVVISMPRNIHSLKNTQMDFHGSWIWHKRTDIHLSISNKWKIRHGYRMDPWTPDFIITVTNVKPKWGWIEGQAAMNMTWNRSALRRVAVAGRKTCVCPVPPFPCRLPASIEVSWCQGNATRPWRLTSPRREMASHNIPPASSHATASGQIEKPAGFWPRAQSWATTSTL